jgi:hypothetical protein
MNAIPILYLKREYCTALETNRPNIYDSARYMHTYQSIVYFTSCEEYVKH